MSRQIFVFSVLLLSFIQLAPQVFGLKQVYLRDDAICDAVYAGGYLDLTTDPCTPAGCDPFNGIDSPFRKTINCPATAPDDFVVTAGWPYVYLNDGTDCAEPLIEATARYDYCVPTEVKGAIWWITLSCGANGGVNVTRCKDSCGGSQCENWIASDACTAHLGSCSEYVPVAVPVAEPVTFEQPIAPIGIPLPTTQAPTSNLQSGAVNVVYCTAVISAAVMLAFAI